MKDMRHLIEPDTMYKPSEVAKPGHQNSGGKGLLDIHYVTLRKLINKGEIPVRGNIVTKGGYQRMFIKGSDLIEYIDKLFKEN